MIEVIGGILLLLFPLFGAFLVAQWFLGNLFPGWSITGDWRGLGLFGAAALMWAPLCLYVTRSPAPASSGDSVRISLIWSSPRLKTRAGSGVCKTGARAGWMGVYRRPGVSPAGKVMLTRSVTYGAFKRC